MGESTKSPETPNSWAVLGCGDSIAALDSGMKPTYAEYAQVLSGINDGKPVASFRQDYVYELFRRGLLVVDSDDRLRLSDAGRDACNRLARGDRVKELDA